MTQPPMFVIDEERNIRMRNAGAMGLLARQDLVLEDAGRLACRDPESHLRLQACVQRLGVPARGPAHGNDRVAIWLRRSDGGCAPATLHALREDGAREKARTRMLLTVFEPGRAPSVDPQVLAVTFDFTAAEARLAALIALGRSTSFCARELGVKTSTLRTHLSAIYRKSGANGKADLVRLVLSLCAI